MEDVFCFRYLLSIRKYREQVDKKCKKCQNKKRCVKNLKNIERFGKSMGENYENIERLRRVIRDANSIVAFCGADMVRASGYADLESDDVFYDIEERYHASTTELYSSRCFNTRPEKFFEFYRNEVIGEQQISAGYYALAELERRGKIRSIITKDVHGIPQKAGCQRVIEPLGNIYKNECPKCKRQYGIDYIKNGDKVPRCESCHTAIHPGIVLPGEMVPNHIMTAMVDAISRADVLLLLGMTEVFYELEKMIQYYKQDKLVYIRKMSMEPNDRANIFINDTVEAVLPQAII